MSRTWFACEWPAAAGGGCTTTHRTLHATEAEALAAAKRKVPTNRYAVVYEIELEEPQTSAHSHPTPKGPQIESSQAWEASQ